MKTTHHTVEIGAYTCRQYDDGWWVTLTATGEQLRGPLPSLADAEDAAERYERLTAGLAS